MCKLQAFWSRYGLDLLVILVLLIMFLGPGLVARYSSVTPFNQHGGTIW
jgi:hypothetical protein